MKTRNKFDQTGVSRVKPRKKFGKTLRGKVRKLHAHISEFDDDSASSKVVRWLFVVLLLHLIFIGGASLHGYLTKNRNNPMGDIPSTAIASTPSVSQHQAAPAVMNNAAAATETQATATVASANAANQTGPAVANAEPVRADIRAGSVKHYVAAGDNWETIARDYNCTVNDLKVLNPGAKLISGTTLAIPMSPEEAAIPVAVPVDEEGGEEIYIVKKGDTLSKIAKQFKISVNTLQSHNNITDPRKVRIGQELKIPAK